MGNKVVLINPPSPFLINERVFPNVGMVRVATALDKENDVSFLDFAGTDIESAENTMRRLSNSFDYYLFGGTSPQFKHTHRLFNTLKESNPNVKTVIGGPHASAMSSLKRKGIEDPNIKTLDGYDTVFEGEGESTENIFKPGWQKGELVKKLDDVKMPDEKFIDRDTYHYNLLGKDTTSVQTQRGCPFTCNFCCGRDIEMYNKIRQHSPERVVEEMDRLNEQYGYESFMWYDDEINVNPGRLEELCDRLSKRPYQHRGFIRSDILSKHPEQAGLLKKAGFVKLCTGVESGSDRMLKALGKGVTVEQNYAARKLIQEAGIHYEAFTMMGLPGETKQDVEETVDWLKKARPDDFDIGLVTPYPGSKMYDEAVGSDKFKGYDWEFNGLYFNKPDFSREDSFYKGLKAQSASFTRTDSMPEKYIHAKRDKIQKMVIK